ncbi:RagB/SusD family nutrient uptake outer membrane protein [Dokdonia sp. Hel_I_53]|uniref:RagB/SusD family nutrient uptake outer membrane protein n=1 Tax=Dokdonia sp. Hel_I_53 TaxID=1566287 RepID=UPI00119938A9|nr:RagB/SusD family nutrient uptake outer membrane protein [Dokdonia sp. Hel_I_53]TVZ52959.1 putative outer membrane starch-binding protein [Dokdonia sp. Hel_I_53]
MKNNIYNISKALAISATLLIVTSCSLDEVIDPDGPSVDGVIQNATRGQLNELVVGVESTLRNGIAVETTASGTMARELYLFDADPRNTGDLLGKDGIQLDNNSFYSTTQWNGSYRCIKNANLLIEAATNSNNIDEQERNGYTGFAKTLIAYELIQMIKSYGTARVDTANPENLGPLLSESEVLSFVRNLLDEANQELNNSEIIFTLSSGFDGDFTFSEFNRAIAAMAAVYDGDGNGALTALDNSYFSINGDLTTGPKHIFGAGGGNQLNGLFKAPSNTVEDQNNGDNIIVHDSWINDAESGDSRVTTKTALRPDPTASVDGLTGAYETRLYSSQTAPIDILRNEELILIYAEASILAGNFDDAVTALSRIRTSATLDPYTGDESEAALTSELLRQRRYSLWAENSRLYDVRRYNLEGSLPIDRSGDQVFTTLPVPLAENN